MYQDLDDIVFEDRHKAYGAYAFRKHYDHTLTKALLIGIAICLVILLFVVVKSSHSQKTIPVVQDMVQMDVTNMLINFGDNTNGKGLEEPKKEEGSPAPLEENPLDKETATANLKESKDKESNIIPDNTVPVPTRIEPKASATAKSKNNTAKTKSIADNKTTGKTKVKGPIKKEGATGDGQGNAALGNLLKGRGTKTGSQGTGTGTGNYGDPLGGDSDGDSTVGVDRKLTGFIPGTMGRGGEQPKHNCTGSGSISIAYTVNKAGNVISASRSSGVYDPCVVSTSVQWVKQFVKAEKSNVSSKGTYKIIF